MIWVWNLRLLIIKSDFYRRKNHLVTEEFLQLRSSKHGQNQCLLDREVSPGELLKDRL
jgi:hypothetical protein